MNRSFFRVIFLLIFILIAFVSCQNRKSNETGGTDDIRLQNINAQYVGRENCKACHEKAYKPFKGSDHDMAMDTAVDATVLGDFNDATFNQHGITSRFFKKDGRFFVNTEGSHGAMEDFEVKYVFGVRPLQQYLMEFPDGAYQCLPLCWDTRPVEEGGQRWFHIYGDERILSNDILFWTSTTQNWNYMCAECHSTNLKKGYDYKTRKYHTSWSEIDVSCEACHGPGSIHTEWARAKENGKPVDQYFDMGLNIRLKDLKGGTWIFKDASGTAERTVERKSNTLIDMCARCHSRRGIISEDYIFGKSLLDTHRPSLLEENLYFPDGQIQDEVYVYASFLQSKMYEAGVVCSDCHEPHSTKVSVQGNALCYRCHMADKYGSKSHHFHKQSSAGAKCVECHMPERTYMVVDPRRDHSMRIPRPDLSLKLKGPDACSKCHDDKSNEWVVDYYDQWYGTDYKHKTHYGEVIWAGRQNYPEAFNDLVVLADSTSLPVMIRATALSLLANYNDPETYKVLEKALNNPEPLIRNGALESTLVFDMNARVKLLTPLLNDSVRLIRMMAGRFLAGADASLFSKDALELRDKALGEYLDSQLMNADNPGGYLNIAMIYLETGEYDKAEDTYKKAIEVDPAYILSYINLADLYRVMGRDNDGEQLLRTMLKSYPNNADGHHSLGLLLVRNGKQFEAIEHIRLSTELAPENARYAYVYAVGINSLGRSDEALTFLKISLDRFPYDRNILYTLVSINLDQGRLDEAKEYMAKLVEYFPYDQSYQQLYKQLSEINE